MASVAATESPASNLIYNLGIAYALVSESDSAFEWLGKAKATGVINMMYVDGTDM